MDTISRRDIEADVLVIGAGNAAAWAALSARETTAKVMMLEAAPEETSGGNSRFTGGMLRFVYHGMSDLEPLLPELTETERNNIEMDTYTEDQFFDDLGRLSQ